MTTKRKTKKGGASNGTSSKVAERVPPNFQLIRITENASRTLTPQDLLGALGRHLACDWGNVSPQDRRKNQLALKEGGRLFSEYRSSDSVKFWIITDEDRSVTTVLLPEEY